MSERSEQQIEELWNALNGFESATFKLVQDLREEVERGTHESTTIEEMEGLFRHIDRLEQRIEKLEARDDR
jgi:polyhydroxyalkanoate synthesis regulator phasin